MAKNKLMQIADERGIDLEKELRRLYIDEELGSGEIAKQFGVAPRTIRNNLKKLNIKVRSRVQGAKLFSGPKHPMYGKKHSEEYKVRQSEKMMKIIRERGGGWGKGRTVSQEVRFNSGDINWKLNEKNKRRKQGD